MTYRVDFKVPWLPGFVEIDNDLFVWETQLLDHDMCAVCPRASMVCIQGELRSTAICRHNGGDGVVFDGRMHTS
jgi:hypothetical protein